MAIKGEGPRHGGTARPATTAAQKAAELALSGEQREGQIVQQIKWIRIRPDPGQPRTYFNPEKLRELADSIIRDGQEQAIKVRPVIGDPNIDYEVITGERRWRSCKINGREFIDAIVITDPLEEEKIRERQLAENIQREDLTLADICREITRFREVFKRDYQYLADNQFQPLAKGSADWVADRYRTWGKANEGLRDLMQKRDDIFSHAMVIVSAPPALENKLVKQLASGATVSELRNAISDYKDELERQDVKEREQRERAKAMEKGRAQLAQAVNGITLGFQGADYRPQHSTSTIASQPEAQKTPTPETEQEDAFDADAFLALIDSCYDVLLERCQEMHKATLSKGNAMAIKSKLGRLERVLAAEGRRL